MTNFTEEQRARAIKFLEDNGDLNVMTPGELMKVYEPYQIARMVKMAGLDLDCNYVRVTTCCTDLQEADALEYLVSDDEIAEALEDLRDATADNSQGLEIDTNVRDGAVYTKETPENLPLFLGKLDFNGVWALVSADVDGNVDAVDYEDTMDETLRVLNDELQSYSLEDVKELNEFNIKNVGSILSFCASN